MSYKYGQILIIKDMVDPNGVNPKNRRTVVITKDSDLAAGMPLVVVAIGGLLPNKPNPSDSVPLQWGHPPAGHAITKLIKPSAAICSWFEQIDDLSRILEIRGRVVEPYLSNIAAKLLQLRSGITAQTGTSPSP